MNVGLSVPDVVHCVLLIGAPIDWGEARRGVVGDGGERSEGVMPARRLW